LEGDSLPLSRHWTSKKLERVKNTLWSRFMPLEIRAWMQNPTGD